MSPLSIYGFARQLLAKLILLPPMRIAYHLLGQMDKFHMSQHIAVCHPGAQEFHGNSRWHKDPPTKSLLNPSMGREAAALQLKTQELFFSPTRDTYSLSLICTLQIITLYDSSKNVSQKKTTPAMVLFQEKPVGSLVLITLSLYASTRFILLYQSKQWHWYTLLHTEAPDWTVSVLEPPKPSTRTHHSHGKTQIPIASFSANLTIAKTDYNTEQNQLTH